MYKPTQNGQMKLQLSNDKKYILLPIFEKSKASMNFYDTNHMLGYHMTLNLIN